MSPCGKLGRMVGCEAFHMQMKFASGANHFEFKIADFAASSFFQRIIINRMMVFAESQLFQKVPFLKQGVLVATRCAISVE